MIKHADPFTHSLTELGDGLGMPRTRRKHLVRVTADFTTLGDTVNTASRLESFDKSLYLPHLEDSPVRILVGESTLRRPEQG